MTQKRWSGSTAPERNESSSFASFVFVSCTALVSPTTKFDTKSTRFRFRQPSGRAVATASLAFAFLLVAGPAAVPPTFSTNSIAWDGSISLNPTGQPIAINGANTSTRPRSGGSFEDRPLNRLSR